MVYAARPREVMSAAIAETGLSSFREILRLGTIAEIEGIASTPPFAFAFTHCPLHLRLRLLARASFEPLLNLADIGLGLGPLGSTAKICTSRFAYVQRLLPAAATVEVAIARPRIPFGELVLTASPL